MSDGELAGRRWLRSVRCASAAAQSLCCCRKSRILPTASSYNPNHTHFQRALLLFSTLSQLPLLIIDDKPPLAQSGSIMRYVAGLAGLVPKDPLEAAACDSYFEAAQEL